MRMRRLAEACFFVLALTGAPRADAQACAGFTDVSGFCQEITWLKNRQITLGCNATEYCPDDAVSRLSMAAFMNRLGNVVTPVVLSVEESGGTLDPMTTHYVCQTDVLPARDYIRIGTGTGGLSFEVTGLKHVSFQIVFSTNGGTTWNPIGHNHDFPALARGTAGSRQHAQTATIDEFGGSPTITRRYALQVFGEPGQTQSISSWTCQLQLTIWNRRGFT